jgi:AraC-like DNA-binding protein
MVFFPTFTNTQTKEIIMDVLYENLSKETEFSINCLDVNCPSLIVPWHFHRETELIFIEKGSGTRFVGDHSESFGEGDIGLIGSNLPHEWRSDPIYRDNIPGLSAHVLVVHFNDEIYKGALSLLPEMKQINQLLFQSQFGIKFFGSAKENIEFQMKELMVVKGIEKFIQLTKILTILSKTNEKQLLASEGYSKIRQSSEFNRFDKTHRYMIENFQENIKLETISNMIGMTPTSFCRYFKKHTNKSFHTVLNEIRIGHACKLLIKNEMSIAGICYESGFSNVSNFNEQFKKLKGLTPSQYIKIRQGPS